MTRFLQLLTPVTVLALSLAGCGPAPPADQAPISPAIEANDLRVHIGYLAGDSLKGRETGSPEEAQAANYIADLLEEFGLQPAGDNGGYYQHFTVDWDRAVEMREGMQGERRLTRNVAGFIPGRVDPHSYIVVGAHYDHLGRGAFGSRSRRNNRIHNGADDNASGTAGLLELAHYFAEHPPRRSLLFTAFSAEEIGLLGSRHFVDHPPVPLDRIDAMINLDMIGRMRDRKLLIFGTESADRWPEMISSANSDSLQITALGMPGEGSDHLPFYEREIPVLHYFTDLHPEYHRPGDDPDLINYSGQDLLLDHTRRLIQQLDTLEAGALEFRKTGDRGRMNR